LTLIAEVCSLISSIRWVRSVLIRTADVITGNPWTLPTSAPT